jgi:hypothetical protein
VIELHITGYAWAIASVVQVLVAPVAHSATPGTPALIVWLLDVVVVNTA